VKRSRAVPLLVLGSIASLPGCAPDHPIDLQQKRYLTLEECQRDWGNDQPCAPGNRNDSGGRSYYYGPRYYWDSENNRPVTVDPNGQTHPLANTAVGGEHASSGEVMHVGSISRGGFGSLGHGFSAGE